MHADIVAGGCLNGQVILWDLRQIDAKGGESKGGGGDGSSQGTAKVPVVRHVMLSDVDASHSKCIMGLEWLPNIEILRDYRYLPLPCVALLFSKLILFKLQLETQRPGP